MKKMLYCAAALASMLFAASCQQEKFETMGDGMVTFTVTAPGDLDTRAYADGENVNEVHYAVYKTNDGEPNALKDSNSTPLAQGVVEMSNKRATLELDLLQDQYYTILFWAQVEGAGHYNVGDLRNVSVVYNPLYGNDESRAAFFLRYDFDTMKQQNYDVTLVRPFAQINLGTTVESLSPVQEGQTQGYTIDVQQSAMTVSGIASSFNLVNGQAANEAVDFTFTSTPTPAKAGEVLTVNGINYHYVAMNYLLVPVQEKLVNVSYTITTDKGVVTNTITSVPVKENYRTNILGNLLTSKTDFEIVVDEAFEVPEMIYGDSWTQTGDYSYAISAGAANTSLKEILEHADAAAKEAATKAEAPEVTITLNGPAYWETGAGIGSTPLLPEDSPITSVVIKGNGHTFTATGKGVGQIRLANGGKLTFKNVKIVDQSVSYAENSWEYGYLEFGGVIRLENCEVVNAIMVSGETAAFKDCSFNSNKDNEYAVWVDNGSAFFTNCTFSGARGLKVHEAYGSEVVKVSVDGCTFGPLTVKPGIALGDLNAQTAVAIKNSLFNKCQAGDQGNYAYETDTDVTTFDFTFTGNTVIPSGDGVIDQGDGKTAAVANTENLADAISEGYTTIMLAEGVYVIPDAAKGKTLTFIGTGNPEDTKIATDNVSGSYEGCNYALDGSTVVFENISINTPSSTYIGYARCNGTYNNCIINGTYTLYGNSVFNDCTFNVSGDVYNIWTWGAPTAEFNNCTFNSDGKALLLYGQVNTELTVDGCTFNDKGGLTDLKAAIEIGNDYNTSYTLVVDNTIVNGYEVNDKGTVTGMTLWANKNSMTPDNLSVTIDGRVWLGGSLYQDAEGNIYVNSAAGLAQAAAYASEGTTNVIITKDLEGDATLVQKPNVKLIINGNDKKFKGAIIVDGKSATYTTAGLTIKELTFDADAISADACINLGAEGDNNTRYTCNVTVEDCTFDVPGAVGVKSYTGGDKNLTISGCTATANAHSLVQAKGIDGIIVDGCDVYSKNGMNFNNSNKVNINSCEVVVRGYAARFGEGSTATGDAEEYSISDSSLTSTGEEGDAVIVLRGSADKSILTITSTDIVGEPKIANNAVDAKVTIDGVEF